MITAKRKHDAGIHETEQVTKRTSSPSNSAVLGYNAHAPWLHDAKPSRAWRTLGDRAVPPSLPLANMVSTVQDLIDPDFDPLVAILDDEPRFLKPLPSRIAAEDLEFLRFRGVLSIPESELRNELLRCYVKWVHSFIPVINLQEFLRCVAENDPNGNISLLLFQAVMFVATAFIDLKHLQAAGYSSRKQARNAFYTPLRLLYSLDCEDDRIVILQTLLLMTYWCDLMNHPNRDIWDWIGICNIQAHSIGLNRDPSSAPNMDQKTKRLRVRLWWSLYARDRLIAMGLRRPTQVNEGTSNVPLLRLEDFDFEPYHPAVVELFHCRQLEDSSHQKRLATMFIEKTKLCQSIGRVLFAQYSPSQRQFGMTHRTTIALVPRQASESELARCSQRLESWLNSLPKDAQFIPATRPNSEDGEDVLLLHGAMLRMLYHTTISALHRPWAFTPTKDDNKARHDLANTARTKMHDAAVGITQIIQGLNRLNLTRFLPQSGVTVITPAAVAHLASTMSDNPSVREAGIFNFQRCIQVLQGMKEIYPAADMEMANVEAAVKVQTGSVGTFLRIMQYNDRQSEPQKRRDSLAPTVQTIPSPSDDQIPPEWATTSPPTSPTASSTTALPPLQHPTPKATSSSHAPSPTRTPPAGPKWTSTGPRSYCATQTSASISQEQQTRTSRMTYLFSRPRRNLMFLLTPVLAVVVGTCTILLVLDLMLILATWTATWGSVYLGMRCFD
ncbi:transcription factor domain-containing protein [Aspergillus candidus]|uniref:Fungal-specific transcription factor domain-domain-containing protein n=1 Tax=Aspergillus candidus TaxID=41067 RepID=A0A2I2FAM2_ASPCN|nr:fungal-specific transcription factor domain-domain-containing protein [Aspergillus candidus]PLB37670.1 fungal-specific transcription factor domain-domain-containing protein [Aspergillus candidus]